MSQPILQINRGINTLPLYNAILRNPTLWNRHAERRGAGGPHYAGDDIWVRYNAKRNFNPAHPDKFSAEHDSVWYPEYHDLRMVDDIIFPLMASVKADRLGGVLITKVPAGQEIKPHKDNGWHATYYDKYAVQITSAPEQKFCHAGGSELISAPGDIYWFNNQVEHWVTNSSPFDRITMVVCLHHSKSAP